MKNILPVLSGEKDRELETEKDREFVKRRTKSVTKQLFNKKTSTGRDSTVNM